MSIEIDHSRRGLAKLMLKFPALRGQFQVLSLKNADFLSLCGALDEASLTLERMRKENNDQNKAAIEEYENICREIEYDILKLFTK